MKKRIVVAAMVALMGVGGYLGHRSMTCSNSGESDLLLANAEALAKDELFDTSCEPKPTYMCVLGPFCRIDNSIGNNDPEYPGY